MKTKYKTVALQLVFFAMLAACEKQETIDYPQAVHLPSLDWPKSTNHIDTIRLMMIGL